MTEPHAPAPGPFDELDALLAAIDPATKRSTQARAMCRLDRMTHPEELLRTGQEVLGGSVLKSIEHLHRRIFDRARWHLARHPFEPNRAADEAHRTHLENAEALFRQGLVAAFEPYPGQMLDLRRFQDTFAAWACGELSTEHFGFDNTTHDLKLLGIPDGANFFCFAESALTFVHMGLTPMFWRPTLSTFVCGAALFAAHHWQPNKRRWDRYTPHPRTRPSSDTFARLRDHRYAAMPLVALAEDFGCTVALALRDEKLVKSFPVPSTPEFQGP